MLEPVYKIYNLLDRLPSDPTVQPRAVDLFEIIHQVNMISRFDEPDQDLGFKALAEVRKHTFEPAQTDKPEGELFLLAARDMHLMHERSPGSTASSMYLSETVGSISNVQHHLRNLASGAVLPDRPAQLTKRVDDLEHARRKLVADTVEDISRPELFLLPDVQRAAVRLLHLCTEMKDPERYKIAWAISGPESLNIQIDDSTTQLVDQLIWESPRARMARNGAEYGAAT